MTTQTIHVSVREAKRDFSNLTNLVYYSGRRVIVKSRGKPKVAIVKLDDQPDQDVSGSPEHSQQLQLHQDIKAHRQKIAEQSEGKLSDPVEILHQLRHDRINHIINVVRGY